MYCIFLQQVGVMFQKMVIDAGSLKVTAVSKKEERKVRPNGLNTVDMLKVCLLLILFHAFLFPVYRKQNWCPGGYAYIQIDINRYRG